MDSVNNSAATISEKGVKCSYTICTSYRPAAISEMGVKRSFSICTSYSAATISERV